LSCLCIVPPVRTSYYRVHSSVNIPCYYTVWSASTMLLLHIFFSPCTCVAVPTPVPSPAVSTTELRTCVNGITTTSSTDERTTTPVSEVSSAPPTDPSSYTDGSISEQMDMEEERDAVAPLDTKQAPQPQPRRVRDPACLSWLFFCVSC
jgi:hypothetical protein